MIYLRIICLLVLLASTVLLPLPVTVGIFLISASLFSRFWESILAGVFLDSFYFSPFLFSKLHLGFFTVSFIVIILVMEKMKRVIEGRNILSKLLIAISGGLSFAILFFLFY